MSLTAQKSAGTAEPVDLLGVLRQNLEDGSQPPAAVLHATAEAARILSGADGIALALRTKGMIVCRARSGDPTPELGAPLSTDSGISGECVRTASILVCHDTALDPRVDPDVCRAMGIQSIAVVPLRGPAGIAGILEAFSTRAGSFGDEQITFLRALGEIAEAAYQRECSVAVKAAFDAPKVRERAVLTTVPVAVVTEPPLPARSSHARRYWVAGLAVTAMLLIAGVWLSGREPSPEAATKEPSAAPHVVASESAGSSSLPEISLPKPKAGISTAERNRDSSSGASAAGSLKKAAQIETETNKDSQPVETASNNTSASQPIELRNARPAASTETSDPVPEAPTVTIATAELRPPLAGLTGASNALPAPTLAARISEGVVRGALIHKVDPVYPAQAMRTHISGNVTLEVTIAEDGKVRDVKKINGSPVLVQAATDAVRQWRYSPSLLDNKPVEVHVQVTVLFKQPGDGNE